MPARLLTYLTRVVLLAAAWAVLARLSRGLVGELPLLGPARFPMGLGIAFLTMLGPRYWPAIAIGTVFGRLGTGMSAPAIAGIAVVNSSEVLLACWILRRVQFERELARLRDGLWLVLTGVVLCAMPAALLATSVLCATGESAWGAFWTNLSHWWRADALGVLLMAPLVFAWSRRAGLAEFSQRGGELAALAGALVVVSWLVFVAESGGFFSFTAFVFPFLAWGALRFGPQGATAANLVVAVFAVWATLHGRGPFVRSDMLGNVTQMQAILAVLTATNIVIAALVTEATRAKAGLSASEGHLRAILDADPGCVKLLGPDGELLSINRAGAELVGADGPEQLLGRCAFDLVALEHRDDARRLIARAADGQAGAIELELVGLAGRRTWVELRAQPMPARVGSPRRVLAVSRDISEHRRIVEEQRRAIAALRASEERYELASAGANDGLWDWDLVGGVSVASPRVKELLGYRADEIEISATDWIAWMHPDDKEGTLAALQAHLEHRAPYDVEFRLKLRSGDYGWFHGRGQAVWDDSGRAVRMVGSLGDIGERKRAELALRETEARLQLALEAGRIGIWDWDMVSDKITWSRGHEALWGMAPGSFQGTYGEFEQRVHPDDLPVLEQKLAEAVAAHRTYQHEFRIMWPDGSVHWIAGQGHAFYATDGKPVRAAGVVQDITSLKHSIDEIRELNASLDTRVQQRTAELARTNADLEGFAYSVSHDLRSPLRSISGFAQLLERRHAAALDADGRRCLGNIREATLRMQRLIDDLLAYARLGREELKLTDVPLGEVLASVQRDLAPRIAEAGARIDLAPLLPVVRGDRTLLQQVFANLLDNAIKYHRDGLPPSIAVSWRRDGERIVVGVEDNGIGIAPDCHAQVFEVFRRLHAADRFPGTGIGLAIVRRSMELLDGRVWLESVPGVGSTFFVALQPAGATP